jgi:NAD-dependent SIR2 family protein deacetylase
MSTKSPSGDAICESDDEEDLPRHPPVLSSFDLAGVAEYIKTHRCKNVIVMAGAGISVSAGLPDFRTPGTGLYDNLAKYNLPEPTAVFNINFFRENPAPFYMLARELFPGQYRPTPTHNFIRLLHDKGILLRCFTQNIDSLEAEAGIPKDKIVAAHGNFDSATCIDTGAAVPIDEVRKAIMAGEEGWRAMNAKHGGLVKPDISFFGEKLPDRFCEFLVCGREGEEREEQEVEETWRQCSPNTRALNPQSLNHGPLTLSQFHGHNPQSQNTKPLTDELAGLKEDSTGGDFARCDMLIVMGTSLLVQPFASLIDRVPATCPRLLLNRQPVSLYNPVLAQLSGEPTGFRYSCQRHTRTPHLATLNPQPSTPNPQSPTPDPQPSTHAAAPQSL